MMVSVGLLAMAGVSWAEDSVPEEKAPAGDTLISYGYDAENHAFIVHTSSTDSAYDCTVPAEVLVGYGSVENGSFVVTSLEEEGVAVEFPERPTEDGAEAPEGETDPATVCQFSGSVVGGPNGQINHGQFMKLFHQIVGKKASGCLNRVIAQSTLGKGDDQVRTSDIEDVVEGDEAEDIFEEGMATFETFVATCDPGKKDKGDDHPSNNKNKNKAEKNKADRPRGNSANAPGRSK
ncbi:MAG: hypothetical protein KJO97_12705 [Acidimicrobiia bacterium]|nr:hypothetical protein [Acidimicrobiia bacterium]